MLSYKIIKINKTKKQTRIKLKEEFYKHFKIKQTIQQIKLNNLKKKILVQAIILNKIIKTKEKTYYMKQDLIIMKIKIKERSDD